MRRCSAVTASRATREHLGRGLGVDVDAVAERRRQQRIGREVREDAQLDLRVVGRDEHVAGRGDEALADLHARARSGSGCSGGSDPATRSGRSRRRPG